MDPTASSTMDSINAPTLSPGVLIHGVELLLEFGKLAGHRPHPADPIRELSDLAGDHRSPLNRAADSSRRAFDGGTPKRSGNPATGDSDCCDGVSMRGTLETLPL